MTIQDAKQGRPVFSQFSLFTSEDIGVDEMARRIQIDVDKLIEGVIVACGVVQHVPIDPSVRTDPDSGSDVESGAQFFWITEGGYRPEFRIPTFKEGLIIDGRVDITDLDVNTFVTNVILGYYNDALETERKPITDKYGDDIETLENALESFVRSRS